MTLAGITDGTSNTIAFGEWTIGDGNDAYYTVPSDIVFVGSSARRGTQYAPDGTSRRFRALSAMVQMCGGGLTVAADRTSSHTSQLGMGWAWCLPALVSATSCWRRIRRRPIAASIPDRIIRFGIPVCGRSKAVTPAEQTSSWPTARFASSKTVPICKQSGLSARVPTAR